MHLKNEFVLLLEATREDIKKYYPKVSDEDYNKILDADPTGTRDKVGNLSRLVLDLYKKSEYKFKLDKETLFDIYTAFDVVQKKKGNLTDPEVEKYRNLNMITDYRTLMDVKHYLDQKTSSKIKLKAGDGENIKVFWEDDNWIIKIPLDYQASVKLGRECNANWCTASSAAMTHFNRYVAQDDLYIFINKKTNEAYQYFDHGDGEEIEFNDNKNNPVDYRKFLTENKLWDISSEIQTESVKIQRDEKYFNKRLLERYSTSKSPYIILTIVNSEKFNDALIGKLFKIHKPNLDENILISDDGGGKEYTTLNYELYLRGSKFSTIKNNEETVKMFCEKLHLKNYTINNDLSIDARVAVVAYQPFDKFPVKFNKVELFFKCQYNDNLKSLVGGPSFISGDYSCIGNKSLKNLEGAPEYVGGSFDCRWNPGLENLKGCPKKIERDFSCSNLQYQEDFFDYLPEQVGGDFKYVFESYLSEDQKREIKKIIEAKCSVGGVIKLR